MERQIMAFTSQEVKGRRNTDKVVVTEDNQTVNYKTTTRYFGTHETQLSEGGEADLNKHLIGCKKNPGHTYFIPVTTFNRNHLPRSFNDDLTFEYIKVTADLTVRACVRMTSPERPEFWPNSKEMYPFYNFRRTNATRIGTGMVYYVEKYKGKFKTETCKCQKCKHSGAPNKVWGEIRMITATHVIFDNLEARHTTCRLFYDSQDSPLVTLENWTVYNANVEQDRCLLKCMTCDVELLNKLDIMWKYRDEFWLKVYSAHEKSREEAKLTIIVSHPHGCPKQVSVGRWIDRCVVNPGWTKYTYTTCTCPGSSGAYVHSLGFNTGWYYDRHVHSGVNNMGENFSSTGWDRL